ncbi:MAG: hypothetical protein KAI02_00075, partial [Gammaproteobacteria bacterium]|nr:hypothetical protein [Gammaproteobacteria bacterium]
MRFIGLFIYFWIFLALAIVVMFLGGLSGVVGTFYVMVEQGDLKDNLTTVITILVLIWCLLMVLRYYNKKAIKKSQLPTEL